MASDESLVRIFTQGVIQAAAKAIEASEASDAVRADTIANLRQAITQLPSDHQLDPYKSFFRMLIDVSSGLPYEHYKKTVPPRMWKIFANVKDGVWKARSPATSVSVFYYPLSQMPPQLLKAAVLYFERVRLLVPGKWKITNDRRDNNLRKFLKNTKPLQEEGLLQLVQLREIRVGKAKMKTLADGSLDFTHFPTQFNFTQLALEGVLALANAFPSDEMATKLVSEELDYLARFMEQGEVPITDQRGAQSAFLDSYNNLLTRPELREVRSAFEKDFHVTLMLRTVLETLLPSYDVRSYDDLLELRWRLGDEVGQYRDALAQFLNKLQLQPFEEGADDIRNDVRALDVAIASSKRKQGLPSTGSSGSLSRKAWLVQWRSLPLWPQEHHCPCFSCFRRRRTLRTNMAI